MKKFWLAMIALALAASMADAQTYKVLYNFGSKSGDPLGPFYGVIAQGRDGSLYSTSFQGGSFPILSGTVFRITLEGKPTVLYSFHGSDGANPVGGLTLGTDGQFYGTTNWGGPGAEKGRIFKITPGGTMTFLHDFTSGDGFPFAAPVQGIDGNFYGTTTNEITHYGADEGAVYKMTPSGAYTRLHVFGSNVASVGGPDGPVVQGKDGKFYGIVWCCDRSFFKITPSVDFQTLGTAGLGYLLRPLPLTSGLIQGSDGNFFGASPGSGVRPNGIVFKLTPAGTFILLHGLDGHGDGAFPIASLVQATDGNFYGTAQFGGAPSLIGSPGCGTIFQVTSAGLFTTVYTFPSDGSMGCNPAGTLVQHTNGLLYGAAESGPWGNTGGVFFSLDLGLPPFVRFIPEASRVGQTVGIFGQSFTGTTAVNFNGTPASFTVLSDTYLTAPVPSGATTGFVIVTTPGGTLTSNKKFQVRPQVLSFSPASGPVGTTVVITGVSLGGATRVTFGSTQTSFTQSSDTQVTATVPSGALTGHVGVTTTGAASYGHDVFTVTP